MKLLAELITKTHGYNAIEYYLKNAISFAKGKVKCRHPRLSSRLIKLRGYT